MKTSEFVEKVKEIEAFFSRIEQESRINERIIQRYKNDKHKKELSDILRELHNFMHDKHGKDWDYVYESIERIQDILLIIN